MLTADPRRSGARFAFNGWSGFITGAHVTTFKKTVKFADLVPDQGDIDDLIQSRPRILGEEVLAMGKIRIQYRGELERKDFQEARDHFESKLKD